MATIQDIVDSLSTSIIEISDGRIQEWREGDKQGRFINPQHLAAAMLSVRKAEDLAIQNSTADPGQGCGVTFVL